MAAGADLNKHNKFGATPLNMASAGGHLDTVRLLLGSGCSVEDSVPGQYKMCPTPSMTAALHAHHTVLKQLVEAGAKPDKVRGDCTYDPSPDPHLPDLSTQQMDSSNVVISWRQQTLSSDSGGAWS